MSCEHTLLAGPRKGKRCDATPSYSSESVTIPFCKAHKEAHEEEWAPLVAEAAAKRQKREEETSNAFSIALLHARIPNAETLFKINRHNPSPEFELELQLKLKSFGNKTEATIEDCVTQILFEIERAFYRFPADIGGLSNIRLHAFDWRGWSREEIVKELENRLYTVYVSDKSIDFRAKYFMHH